MNKSANYAMRYEKLSNALQNIPGEQTLQHLYLLFYRKKLSLFSLTIFPHFIAFRMQHSPLLANSG